METPTTSLTFSEFVNLCKDADQLISDLLKGSTELQRKHPINLKAAAVWYLARKRGLHVTAYHIFQIYGVYQPGLRSLRKLIEKEAER